MHLIPRLTQRILEFAPKEPLTPFHISVAREVVLQLVVQTLHIELWIDNHHHFAAKHLAMSHPELHPAPNAVQVIVGQDHECPLGLLHAVADLIHNKASWHPVPAVNAHFVGLSALFQLSYQVFQHKGLVLVAVADEHVVGLVLVQVLACLAEIFGVEEDLDVLMETEVERQDCGEAG